MDDITKLQSFLQKKKQRVIKPTTIILKDATTQREGFYLYDTVDKSLDTYDAGENWMKREYGDSVEKKLRETTTILPTVVPYSKHPSRLIIPETDGVGMVLLNTYNNPRDCYKVPLEKVEMPEIYKKFFGIFFEDDKQREYCLDWVAETLRRKLYTYLALVGNEGVGKGVFCSVLKQLHLGENSTVINDQHFNSRFNDALVGKTLCVFDEVQIKEEKKLNSLKEYANDFMRIEGKYGNAEEQRIYFSLVLCTNHSNFMRLREGQRRVSFPDISVKKLKCFFSAEEISKIVNKDGVNRDEIEQLFAFFWQREITNDVDIPLTETETYKNSREAAMPEWEVEAKKIIIDLEGDDIDAKTLHDKVCSALGFVAKVSKKAMLEKLVQDNPLTLEIVNHGGVKKIRTRKNITDKEEIS